jgi:hypothetical protein
VLLACASTDEAVALADGWREELAARLVDLATADRLVRAPVVRRMGPRPGGDVGTVGPHGWRWWLPQPSP